MNPPCLLLQVNDDQGDSASAEAYAQDSCQEGGRNELYLSLQRRDRESRPVAEHLKAIGDRARRLCQ